MPTGSTHRVHTFRRVPSYFSRVVERALHHRDTESQRNQTKGAASVAPFSRIDLALVCQPVLHSRGRICILAGCSIPQKTSAPVKAVFSVHSSKGTSGFSQEEDMNKMFLA